MANKNVKGEKAIHLKADGTPKKNLGGRPRKRVVNTIDRSKRVPLTGSRDILKVTYKDENFHKQWKDYWFVDVGLEGQEVWRALQAGWDFVQSDECLVGETYVFKTQNVGSIVRTPTRDGRYHFLMKKPLHEYEEDKAEEMYENVDSIEQQMLDPSSGFHGVDKAYGGIKVGYKERDFY